LFSITMPMHSSKNLRPHLVLRDGRRGFALLVTIVLVSFLVLILVGLATFTRVETAVAASSQSIGQARQNATTALNIAIGQLQKHAGPDQRVSARGDAVNAADPKKKNLTGIWDTTKAYAVGADPELWLVSGSEITTPASTVTTHVVTPSNPSIAADEVLLVGEYTVQTVADRIIVKKQPLFAPANLYPGLAGSPEIGAYAYWVGDEGAKACINLVDPTRLTPSAPDYNGTSDWTNNFTRENLNQQMLPQPQIQNEFPGIDILDGNTTLPQLAKVQLPVNLRYVTGFAPTTEAAGAQKIRELFYDITTKSEAVLADLTTGDGRLKIDLSDPAVRPANVANYMSATPASKSDYLATYNVSESAHPVVTEASIRLSFYRDGGRLRMAYALDVELWNPYAAKLQISNDGDGTLSTGETPIVTVEVSGLPVDVDLTTNGSTPTTADNLDLNVELEGGLHVNANIKSPAGDLIWNPGEIKVLNTVGDMLESTTTPSARVANWSKVLADASATQVTVNYGAILNTLEFRLKIGGNVVATYKPTKAYNGGTVVTTATAATSYVLGYGIQLNDSIENWTTVNDPRDSTPDNAAFSNVTWPAGDAEASVGVFDTADELRESRPHIVLFDLPRQEIMSTGELRHAVGTAGAAVPYAAADSLHDRYFVSTVPQTGVVVANLLTRPLPNRYIRLAIPRSVAPAVDADLQGRGNTSARYLMQTGAFNINSTSVSAWKMMLGAKINGWAYNLGSSSANLAHSVFRLPHGARLFTNPPLLSTGIGDSTNVIYTGGRNLTDAEIIDPTIGLAKNIVDEIRNHGRTTSGRPFFSVSDFISSNVLRSAIASANINTGLASDRRGTPGELTQGDIIASLAPFMTPRSDTFKIRAYGEVKNPVTAEIVSKAWCEAVVQRVPDLAEDSNAPVADVANPDFTTTYKFGRKFVITSFRWLLPTDL
jgi:Tfp pilus assembly protein PilX